MTRART
jgi:hypothetical protein